jgi:hypothetical protein
VPRMPIVAVTVATRWGCSGRTSEHLAGQQAQRSPPRCSGSPVLARAARFPQDERSHRSRRFPSLCGLDGVGRPMRVVSVAGVPLTLTFPLRR